MAMMTYLILGVVAMYLFKVNPVLCVGIMGAVVFFKIRGAFGARHSGLKTRGATTTEAALVAMCITLLERSERREEFARHQDDWDRSPDDDPLGGLFLD